MQINNPAGSLLFQTVMEDDAELLPGHFEVQSNVSVT